MSRAAFRDVVARLNLSASTLIALGVAIDAWACGKPFDPAPVRSAVPPAADPRRLARGPPL